MFPPPQEAPIRNLRAQKEFEDSFLNRLNVKVSWLSPRFFGAQHSGPDEVRVDGFFFGVCGADLQGQRLAGGAGQRGQTLDGSARLQGKVRTVELGESFFNQSHPELFPLSLQREDVRKGLEEFKVE